MTNDVADKYEEVRRKGVLRSWKWEVRRILLYIVTAVSDEMAKAFIGRHFDFFAINMEKENFWRGMRRIGEEFASL